MKKLVTLLLATVISGQVMANDFVCKAAYNKKITAIEKSFFSGKMPVALISGGFAVPVAMSALLGLGTLVVLPVGIMIGGTFVVREEYMWKKLTSLATARGILEESFTHRSEIVARAERTYILLYIANLGDRLERVNSERVRIGLPVFTLEEFEAMNPMVPFDPSSVQTDIDALVKQINEDEGTDYSYEHVAETVKELAMTNQFCQGKKVAGKKKVIKAIKARL